MSFLFLIILFLPEPAPAPALNQEISGDCPACVRKKGPEEDQESGAGAGEGLGQRSGG
jgi:hypothetical protein